MTDEVLKLNHPPIVEAVIDFNCDMPPDFNLSEIFEEAKGKLKVKYPNIEQRFVRNHKFEAVEGREPEVFAEDPKIEALIFSSEDKKTIIQFRSLGFSYNRLAPYTSLDDYLGEIETMWKLFIELAKPVVLKQIKLRYINKISLQLTDGKLEFDTFLKTAPRMEEEANVFFNGFLHQHGLIEKDTKNQAVIVLATQEPQEDVLPIIFDIQTFKNVDINPELWQNILDTLKSLREFKNQIFKLTLTEKCIAQYQQ